eukprot:9077-Heterococcus_DN1.PRE.2
MAAASILHTTGNGYRLTATESTALFGEAHILGEAQAVPAPSTVLSLRHQREAAQATAVKQAIQKCELITTLVITTVAAAFFIYLYSKGVRIV